MHFPRTPPGRCSPPRSLCGCTAESLLALLLVDAPHLVLSAVVLRRACSRSLAHFPCAPPGPHVPCALPSHSPRSMAPHWFSLWLYCETLLALPLTLLYLHSAPHPAPSN